MTHSQKFNPQWFLKWIRQDDPTMRGKEFPLLNLCVAAARTSGGDFTGFTVFEPRDLTEDFVRRLKTRAESKDFADSRFQLYIPPFLQHRAEKLGVQASCSFTPYVKICFSKSGLKLQDKVRVINVDDSPVLLKFLKHTLEEMGFFQVIAQVSNPLVAAAEIKKHQPDFVTMDIQMPGKTGVEVVKEVLSDLQVPIIMISSLGLEEGSLVFDALNNGAFDYIQKPKLEDKESFKEELREKVLVALSGSHHKIKALDMPKVSKTPMQKKTSPDKAFSASRRDLIWCLGASTGGTQALTRVFTSLPAEIPPTLVVQHIPPVFSKSFADSLNQLCPFTVKEAQDGDMIKHNHVYIAPGGMQMGVIQKGDNLFIEIRDAAPVNRFKPSVDYMFSDVASLKGLRVVAGLMTGMGKDGAQGLLRIKKLKNPTFAQDEASSAVFGMPRAAIEADAADNVVALDLIAHTLMECTSKYQKVS